MYLPGYTHMLLSIDSAYTGLANHLLWQISRCCKRLPSTSLTPGVNDYLTYITSAAIVLIISGLTLRQRYCPLLIHNVSRQLSN